MNAVMMVPTGISVLVDHAKLPPVGPAHAVDERTQSNWNGVIGRMREPIIRIANTP